MKYKLRLAECLPKEKFGKIVRELPKDADASISSIFHN